MNVPLCTMSILLVAILCILLPRSSHAANATLRTWSCNRGAYYDANSTYQSNVAGVLASLSANASGGFATRALGSAPDRVWGMALCRGDTNGTACTSCIALAPLVAFGQCQGVKDVSVLYDRCLLRYTYEDFLANRDTTKVELIGKTTNSVTRDVSRFNELVATLIGALSDWAAFNTTSRYAVGVMTTDEGFPASQTSHVVHNIHGMVQCTPDQAPRDCRACLEVLMGDMPAVFNGTVGGQLCALWCTLRYEMNVFYDGAPMLKLVAPPPAPARREGNKTTRGSGNAERAVATVLGVLLVLMFMFTLYLWRKAKTTVSQISKKDEVAGSLLFDLSTLRKATANFADENKLGHGGFGAVYKGLLPDGREIAVKRLDKTSGQGLEQLRNELLLVAKLRHNNLAKLLGVCLNGQDKLLVYEYLSNRSLDTFLFEPEKRELLDWNTRYQIIYGTARGLLYLHEDSQIKIIHRDLKASNILLDADMNPKISDFGLARLFNGDKTTTLTSQIAGTLGYMAPEYAALGQMSVKLDVYSFGVLILEIVTGRRNTDVFESVDKHNTLLNYVWNHWTKGTPLEIVDPSLNSEDREGEELKCIHLGLLCVQENPADRPTMLNVFVMLHSETTSFATPSKPAFTFAHSEIRSLNKTENSGGPANHRVTQFSVNEMSHSELHPR